MALTSNEKWGLGAIIGLVAAATAYGVAEKQAPAATPPAPTPPDVTIGPGSTLQQRPLPDLSRLSAASLANYVSTFQRELHSLALDVSQEITPNGNWSDPATIAAVNTWFRATENQNAAQAYNYGGGGGQFVDMAALMNAIDDQVRQNAGGNMASDYRAPIVPNTSGLSAPAPSARASRGIVRLGAAPSGAVRGGWRKMPDGAGPGGGC